MTNKLNKPNIGTLSTRGQSILNSAQQLFFQYGFDETSLAMIIKEAGGSRRAIYSEFGNKQGLLIAVIQRQVSVQSEILSTIDRTLCPEKALNDMCFTFVKGMLSPTIIALFRLVMQQVVKLPALGEIIYQKGLMTGVKPLVEYLDYLTDKNMLQIDNTHFAARMLIEMAKGPLHTQTLILPNKVATDSEIAQQTKQAVSIFLKAHRVS